MAKTICSELKVGPSVEIVSVEFQADRKKLTVYYKKYADVSLCKLIRKLHTAFKMRIWMENIEPIVAVAAQENPENSEMSLSQLFQKLEQQYFDLANIDIQAEDLKSDRADLLPEHEIGTFGPASSIATPTSSLTNAQQPHGVTVISQSSGPRSSSSSHSSVGLPFLPRSGLAPTSIPNSNGQTAPHYHHSHVGPTSSHSHMLRSEYDVSGVLSQSSDQYYQSQQQQQQRHLNPRRRNQLPQRPPVPNGYTDYLPRPPSASMYGPMATHYSMHGSTSGSHSQSHYQSPPTLVHSTQYYRPTGGGSGGNGASSSYVYDQSYDREYSHHNPQPQRQQQHQYQHQQQSRPSNTRSVEYGYGTDDVPYHESNGMETYVSPHYPSSQSKMLAPSYHHEGSRRSSPPALSFQYGDTMRSSSPSTTATSSPYDQMMSLSDGFGSLPLSESAGSQLRPDSYGDQSLNFDRNSRYILPADRAQSGLTGSRSLPYSTSFRGESSSGNDNTGAYRSQLLNSSYFGLPPDLSEADSLLDDTSMMNFDSLQLR